MTAFGTLLEKAEQQGSAHLVLLDPDKGTPAQMAETASRCERAGVDGLLMGGSLVAAESMDVFVSAVKNASDLPVILFPGGTYQLSAKADCLLFLSLLSGRNPHYLVGEQVIAAPRIKTLGLETVGTAYLLIESGGPTSVSFISGTQPIPSDKVDIAVAHGLAAQMMGFHCIYLEAGSGAKTPVPAAMVQALKKHTGLPLIVGGGIRTPESAGERARAGADLIVTGTVIEEQHGMSLLSKLVDAIHWRKNP